MKTVVKIFTILQVTLLSCLTTSFSALIIIVAIVPETYLSGVIINVSYVTVTLP